MVGYAETHGSPAASQDIVRDSDRAVLNPMLSPARPKTGGTSLATLRVAWEALNRWLRSAATASLPDTTLSAWGPTELWLTQWQDISAFSTFFRSAST